MFSWTPPSAKVLLLTDVRNLADANFDHKHKPTPGNQAVLRTWWPGTETWGKAGWANIARVALFEFGTKVTPALRALARAELEEYFSQHNFDTVIVLQSRSKTARKVYNEDYAEASHTGSVCWEYFNPPAPLADMSGTFWATKIPGSVSPQAAILPLQNPQNVDYVYGAMTMRWLAAVRDNLPLFMPPSASTFTERGAGMAQGLEELLQSARQTMPIAIDIESYSTEDLITVIGLSDGHITCSVPWEPFQPHGQASVEPGLHLQAEGNMVRRILATAQELYVWNGIRFDMPYLARKGVHSAGKVFDGYLAHGIIFNQFRHGLQQAVSYEFKIPPWKTAHTHSAEKHGLSRDDAEAWIQDPAELRAYNSSDSLYTWWVCTQLKVYGGVK